MRKIVLAVILAGLMVGTAFASIVEEALLTGVTGTGAGIAVNVKEYKDSKTVYIVATGVGGGATVALQTSYDQSSWVTIATIAITATGTREVAIVGLQQAFIRANITVYADGTYNVNLLGQK